MGLWLVRWYDLRASLIEARDEADLLRAIDEVDSPKSCTWEPYRGPVWVDFVFPADFEIPQRSRNRLGAGDIRPVVSRTTFSGEFRLAAGQCDTGADMEEEVRKRAFPKIAEHLEKAASAEVDSNLNAMERAVIAEVRRHACSVASQGITLDSVDGELVMRRTRTYYFRWRENRFLQCDEEALEAFCFGERSMEPDHDGKVRVAAVEVSFARQKPVAAEFAFGRSFTAGPNGMIVTAHLADAYGEDIDEQEESRFLGRRNDAVRWGLTSDEFALLQAALRRVVGRKLALAPSPVHNRS